MQFERKLLFTLATATFFNFLPTFCSTAKESQESSTTSSVASKKDLLITLPDAKTLEERLGSANAHFMEKTKIHTKLGGTKKVPLGVVMAVELALYDYNENLKDPMMAKLMQMNKPHIIEAILKDSPEAIQQLKDLKLLK